MSHQRAGTAHPDRCRHGAGGPPYVQRFTPEAQHHRDDPRITGEPAGDVGVDRATEARWALPIRPCRTGRLTVTTTWGRSPPSVGRAPSLSAREASSTRASASRCAVVRRSIRAEDLGGFPVQPTGQFIAPVAVVEAQRPAALRQVIRTPAVLIQVRQDPLAQDRELAGVERAGMASQLGFHLDPGRENAGADPLPGECAPYSCIIVHSQSSRPARAASRASSASSRVCTRHSTMSSIRPASRRRITARRLSASSTARNLS
jgi:hypothetical protein